MEKNAQDAVLKYESDVASGGVRGAVSVRTEGYCKQISASGEKAKNDTTSTIGRDGRNI